MNIVTAVRRRLMLEPDLSFARIDKHKLGTDVTGKGTTVIVVSQNGSWRSSMQTARFPRVGLTIYSEDTRGPDGRISINDGMDKALQAWDVADKVLHRPTLETVVWGSIDDIGGVMVLFSNRETEASSIDHPATTVSALRATYDLKTA